ncbi:6-O-methylguanine DNA methyltransferase [Colletotrichum nymphaeae SA-01]|uniref:6-O-methylguanine DNA methyltransferase n=1 Tax=Colletotrichum nymphaeae SA-01 TaxID=1460502 RepID=A0A135UQA7_9PEZI|nr:6-O-methylguanine DNA methyltransferase [Colletotrichum nymphaeae SA-01]
MARTEEAEAFFHAVYTAVQEIPFGKVTTYGHIARLVGTPERPRQVGICLKHLPTDPASRFNNENVPWQRVINAKGTISPRYIHLTSHPYNPFSHRHTRAHIHIHVHTHLTSNPHLSSQPSGARNQAEALQAEDVEVSRTAMGEFQVDFSSYGWFPDVLPSEEE